MGDSSHLLPCVLSLSYPPRSPLFIRTQPSRLTPGYLFSSARTRSVLVGGPQNFSFSWERLLFSISFYWRPVGLEPGGSLEKGRTPGILTPHDVLVWPYPSRFLLPPLMVPPPCKRLSSPDCCPSHFLIVHIAAENPPPPSPPDYHMSLL